MATIAEVPAPQAGLFAMVRFGVLIPTRRWKLFVQVFALAAVPSTALFFVKTLALEPLAAAVTPVPEVAGTDDAFRTDVLLGFLSDHPWLLPASAGYLIANVVLGSAIKIANIFASVVAIGTHGHGDEHEHHHTLVYFLGRVKRNFWGPVVTAAFSYVLQAAYVGTTVVSAAVLYMFLVLLAALCAPWMLILLTTLCPPWMLMLPVVLVFFVALLFYMYLKVVCAVSMVASVAEPGLHGMAAVRRAWRLVRGNNHAQVVLFVALTWALGWAISPLYYLAMAWLPHDSVTISVVWVDAALMYLLVAALDVFSVAAVTAYYFQCKRSA